MVRKLRRGRIRAAARVLAIGPGDSCRDRPAASVPASTSRRICGQSCTPSPIDDRIGVRRDLVGTREHVQPAEDDLDPRARYQRASSYARRRTSDARVIPTTCGTGSMGGGPWSRFSSQYFTSQSAGVAPAMLVSASVGVSTCLPKLACGSFG